MADPQLITWVAGLPAGPATWAGVRAQLRVDDALDDAVLEPIINAVNRRVTQLPIVVDELLTQEPAPEEWPADVVLGAQLLAARLFARRNSPEGVASFSDAGAVYVQRNDPDVAMLLKIGGYARPGIA